MVQIFVVTSSLIARIVRRSCGHNSEIGHLHCFVSSTKTRSSDRVIVTV